MHRAERGIQAIVTSITYYVYTQARFYRALLPSENANRSATFLLSAVPQKNKRNKSQRTFRELNAPDQNRSRFNSRYMREVCVEKLRFRGVSIFVTKSATIETVVKANRAAQPFVIRTPPSAPTWHSPQACKLLPPLSQFNPI